MKYFFIAVLFFSSSVLATEVVIDRGNKYGFHRVDSMKYERDVYSFNGKNIGKKLPPFIFSIWSKLLSGSSVKEMRSCYSGTFKYVIKDGKEIREKKGCAAGKEYAQLIQDLEEVRKFSRTKIETK